MKSMCDDGVIDVSLAEAPAEAAERVAGLARRYLASHTPTESLRFLLDLDARLYTLQGQTSVAYGGGIHTKHRHIRYHDFFINRIRKGETVLDIGCGHGAVACDVAKRADARVTAIDLCDANIRIARDRHAHPGVTYIHGDALCDLPPERFDVVLLSNVLEHIESRVEFLRRVGASAAPKRWLIRVPLFERDWRVPLKKELGLEWRLDGTHFTEYTKESFEEEVEAVGLSITHVEYRWGEIWAELASAST